jgi:RHS repeat-associated protein
VVETSAYDNAEHQTSVVAKKGGTTLTSFAYTWAAGTNDTALRQSVTALSGTTAFGYDAQNRLCYTEPGATTGTCASPPSGATGYTYDATGNRLTKAVGGTTTHYVYNAADELCAASTGTPSCASPTYGYDANGNEVSSPAITALTYTALNQTSAWTVAGTTTTSTYADADSAERVSLGSGAFATSELGIAEDSALAAGPWWYTRTASGDPIGQRSASANSYYLVDGLGSIVALINSSGTTQKTYAYDPFGDATPGGSGTAANLGFAGGYDNTTSGLVKFGTRYYDPTIGRWTQQDPIAAGIGSADGANRYAYAGDSPTNGIDPSGMFCASLSCLDNGAASLGKVGVTSLGAGEGCAIGGAGGVALGEALDPFGGGFPGGAAGCAAGTVGGAFLASKVPPIVPALAPFV